MKNKAILFLLLILPSICMVSCDKKKETPPAEPTVSKPIEPKKIVGLARVEPLSKVLNIGAEVGGIVQKVNVSSGDHVEKGDLLLELAADVEKAQYAEQLSASEITKTDYEATQTTLESTEVKLTYALSKLQRLKNAFAAQAETQQNVDNAESEVKTLQKEIDRIKATLKTNLARQKDEAQKAAILNIQIARRKIKAPVSGTLLSFDWQPGMSVNALANVGELAPDGDIMATTEIDEMFASKVKLGQKAYVRTLGLNDTLGFGTVVYASINLKKKSLFSDTGADLDDRRVREVKVKLDKNDKILLGMRVETVIVVD